MNVCMEKNKKYHVVSRYKCSPAIIVDVSAKQGMSVVELERMEQKDYAEMIKKLDEMNHEVRATYYSSDSFIDTFQKQNFFEWLKALTKRKKCTSKIVKRLT